MTIQKGLICIATLAVLACVSPASADIIVWLDPASSTVDVGGSVSVGLMAHFDEPVVAWGMDLVLDEPAFAAWTDTVIGDDWNPTATLDGDGLSGMRFPAGITGDVRLATVTFEGLVEGTTTLTLSSGPQEDEGFLLEAGSLETNVSFTPASLTVVPEPSALVALSASGLLLLRRRR
ncbi:MAG: PEP-CTERM sorting domain-containing protein [Phycisphaerae bacterium]|jgi:hypothetical protein